MAKSKEKDEKHLTFMRKKYAKLAATALMFADEADGWSPPADVEEEEELDMFQVLPEKGDLLDSYESDTGNPYSGDSVTQLYEYQNRFWVFNGVHGTCEDFDTFEEAYDYGGFKYRDENPDE